MALIRRNRRVLFIFALGIAALAFLYFADIRFFTKSSTFTSFFDDSHRNSFDSRNSHALQRGATEQCEKLDIKSAEADINVNQVYYSLVDRSGHEESGYNEIKVRKEAKPKNITDQPKLKVFVVPFSHVDPGWLKTVDEYSKDTNKMLNNMIEFMPKNPAMTFTWMEISFFEIWWRNLTREGKEITRKLIKDGKFQISSGSWTMTDEATPYYWATIDNLIEGHQFVKRELDTRPNVMWSNDPFGYGPTVPYLFGLADVKRAILQRIHSSIKSDFSHRKYMDFYWRQFFDSKGEHDSHVHLLPYIHYDVPNTCGPNSGICCQYDFKRITHYFCGGPVEPITSDNVARRAQELQDQYRQMSKIYTHNVALVMLGDDFRYEMMEEWSQQHDNYMRLMDYMDRRPEWNIEVRFGTFDDYFKALDERRTEAAKSGIDDFPTLSGDFFPYNDIGDHYWVGYYTTRPFYKRQDRVVQAMIRAADIASSLVYFTKRNAAALSKWFDKMRLAHRNLAIFQHHDAITGTSKWHVVTDYGKRLQVALTNAAEVLSEAVGILAGGDAPDLTWNQRMPMHNETPADEVIRLREGEERKLWLFNPSPHVRSELARYRVSTTGCYVVKSSQDKRSVKAQLNPIFTQTGMIEDEFEILFEAQLPPLAIVPYTLTYMGKRNIGCAAMPKITIGGSNAKEFSLVHDFTAEAFSQGDSDHMIKLENPLVSTYHSSTTGLLQAVKRKAAAGDEDAPVWKGRIEFWFYNETRSGAYIFDPSQPAKPWPYKITTVVHVRGSITDEMHSFANSIHHKAYLRKFSNDFEPASQLLIENHVDIRHHRNVELVMRVINAEIIGANRTFMTDALGLQLMPRRFLPTQRVDRSYYPMASHSILQNDHKRLTILSGQPHGATSPIEGGLEIMLDRILIMDDSKGLGGDSIARDNVPVVLHFRLILENGDFTDSRILSLSSHRSLQNLLYPPIAFEQQSTSNNRLAPYAPLHEGFPCDTLLLNVRPLHSAAEERSSNERRPHLLLLHRVLSDCRAEDENLCQGSSKKAFPTLLSKLLQNAQARDCSLSGISNASNSKSIPLDEYMNAHSIMKPMEIRSICIE